MEQMSDVSIGTNRKGWLCRAARTANSRWSCGIHDLVTPSQRYTPTKGLSWLPSSAIMATGWWRPHEITSASCLIFESWKKCILLGVTRKKPHVSAVVQVKFTGQLQFPVHACLPHAKTKSKKENAPPLFLINYIFQCTIHYSLTTNEMY